MPNKTTLTNLNSFDIDANTINATNINAFKFIVEQEDPLETLYANNLIAPNLYNIVTPAYYPIHKFINTKNDWYNKEVGKLKITSNDYEKYEDISDDELEYLKSHFYLNKLWYENTVSNNYTVDKSHATEYIIVDTKLTEQPEKSVTYTENNIDIKYSDADKFYLKVTLNIVDPSRDGFTINKLYSVNKTSGAKTQITNYRKPTGTPDIEFKFNTSTQTELEEFIQKNNILVEYTYPIKFTLLVIQQYKEYDAEKLDVQNYTINGLNFNVPGGIALLDKDGNFDLSQIKKATTTNYGIVKLAETSAEKSANPTDNENVVTPAGLYAALYKKNTNIGYASVTEAGKVFIVNSLNESIEHLSKEQQTKLTISKNYLDDYLNSETVGYVDKTTFNNYKSITDSRLTEIEIKVASGFRYKGQVNYYSELPATADIGDVYNVKNSETISGKFYPAGMNYVWNGNSWDQLGADGNQYVLKSNVIGDSNRGSLTKPIYFDIYGVAHPITSYEGNSYSATKLETARNFNIIGAAPSNVVSFNGTKEVTLTISTLDGPSVVGNIPGHANQDLSLSGGIMTGQVNSTARSTSWISGRDGATYRNSNTPSSPGTYQPLTSVKSLYGSWETGTLGNNYYITYASDSNYSAGVNSVVSVYVTPEGYIYANRVYNAVYNDYAECFVPDNTLDTTLRNRIVQINKNGKVQLATEESETVIGILSDSYGHMLGGSEEEVQEGKKVPVGLAGTLYVDSEYIVDIINIGKYIYSGNNGFAKVTPIRNNKIVGKIIGVNKDKNQYRVILCL